MDIGTLREAWGLGRWASKLGPYVVIEAVVPGGTLVALLLFLYQRRRAKAAAGQSSTLGVAVSRILGRLRGAALALLEPFEVWPTRASASERDGLEPLEMICAR